MMNYFNNLVKTKSIVTAILVMMCSLGTLYAADATSAPQQGMTITGVVVDNIGETLPGVNIMVKGTATGTVTDIDGRFSLAVPNSNAVLVFSFVGYMSHEINVSGRTVINVTLLEDAQLIDEVVVVGYGVQRRSSITGSAQALNNAALQTATVPRTENMLGAKVPGVFVAGGTGQPGSAGAIIIRGQTTISTGSNNRPLWVIDGVIVGSNGGELNPADIESLTVLKDAASTAIYGSQGSNGVIVITTRRGRAGEARINFSARGSLNTLNSGNLKMMNGKQLYDYWNTFSNPEKFNTASYWSEDLKNRDYSWWDGATQTGKTQDYLLTFSGGTDRLTAYASLGYYNESGALKGYDFTRYTGRANFTYKVKNWLTIRPSLSVSMRDIFNQQHSATAIMRDLPWHNPYRKDGTLVKYGSDADPLWTDPTRENYMYNLQWNYTASKHYEVSGNFDVIVQLADWLTFESVNNYRFTSRQTTEYADPRSTTGTSTRGYLDDAFNGGNRIYTNSLFRFTKTFNTVHTINGILAYEWNESSSSEFAARGYSIPAGALILNLASEPGRTTGNRNTSAVQSFFANVNYDYARRYMLQGSVRRDGATNFGRKTRYGNFFSLSAAWNMHEEEFIRNLRPLITNLKPRISFGSSGNRPSQNYPQYTIYNTSMTNSYNGIPGALVANVAGNDEMTWETTYTTNVGVDAAFFDSRLNVTFDYYVRNTSGLLYQVPLPSVWGVTQVWRNVGEVRNSGMELTVGGSLIRTADIRWNIEANIGMNRNKVQDLYGESKEIIRGDVTGGAQTILKPGYDITTWWVPEWAGVNPDNGMPQWYTTDASGKRVITSVYSEASANMTMCGTFTPDFFGGFNTAFQYKGFDIGAVFGYSVGGKIYNYSRTEYDSDGAYTDRNQMVLMKGWSRWEKPGDIATHPRPMHGNNTNSEKVSSRFLEDGSYLKLRSVTAGYNLPFQIPHISNVRVYVSGENLFTLTNYSSVDPEISPRRIDRDNEIRGTFSVGQYPSVRRYTFGLNVTF